VHVSSGFRRVEHAVKSLLVDWVPHDVAKQYTKRCIRHTLKVARKMAGTEYDGNLESEWRVLDLADVREGWEAGA